ncbi:FAD-dependent oxidoreductase [Allobranchiibius huperziae]|uniref:2-polyprenyl-6-methoxyphenol hydroxylase-like FAD-dependent oxidoreductase n=1 Tax=Allobranchiibius huperziae TaxID=1874116 RepID=A0A853DN83_9MICO|nr:FAD-dependent oxidoreductase [Allobranchiibius huperziae]NYJ75595.1 2-polyprenyl-6-methoxyphenol hydroxylase-like FAD-dependent oxidoreductase [Allobranchiibius huperziae]
MGETTHATPTAQTSTVCAVLIVGAGPTGLTLAVELAGRGISHRLLEAVPGPQEGSRGKGIQPRTLEVFEDLGIAGRVLAHGQLAMPIRSTAPDGRVTLGGAEPESLKNRPDIPYTTSLVTPQWRVEEALRLRLSELGGAVEFGAPLLSFTQSDLGVSAVVESGEGVEAIEAQWLVGCDGGRSSVRRQAAIPFEGETLEDVRMIVADVGVDGLDRDAWQMWRHPDGFLSLCPLPSTDVFQYQSSIAPGQDPQLGLDNLQSILERRSGRTDLRLHEPTWSSLWRANIRLVDHYRRGRVLLAGDAAHVHSPAGGQGMNTGIQDAHNLGWKLAAVVQGAPNALIDSYEAERRPIAELVLGLSNARLAQTVQGGMATRRDASTLQLDLNYRGSTLALDDRDDNADLRAGDRAPDATGLRTQDGEYRLFDLTRGGRFTLLAFGGMPPIDHHPGVDIQTLRVAVEAREPDQIVDTHGSLHAAYGANDLTLALIRPDGYLAALSHAGHVDAVNKVLADVSPTVQPKDQPPIYASPKNGDSHAL